MKISFLRPAQTEFEEATEYYDKQRAGLGMNLQSRLLKRWIASATILTPGRSSLPGYFVVWLIGSLIA